MCGRYNIIDDAATRALLESLGIPVHFPTRINMAPTETVPVIIQSNDGPEVHEMRWWLTPSWAPEVTSQYSMFNARVENLNSSLAFKGPFHHRRAIIPASSFIEWKKSETGEKQPYLLKPAEGCFAFAGLWDVWQKQGNYLESCSVITTSAIDGFKWLHHRMPLLIAEEDLTTWLDNRSSIQEISQIADKRTSIGIQAYPLSTAVNNSRNKDPNLISALDSPIEIKH